MRSASRLGEGPGILDRRTSQSATTPRQMTTLAPLRNPSALVPENEPYETDRRDTEGSPSSANNKEARRATLTLFSRITQILQPRVFTDRKLPETTWPGDDGQVQPDPDPDASTMRRVEGISDLGLLTTGQDDARGSETARRTSNRDARDWTDWMQMLAEGLWLPSYSAIVLGTFLVAFIGYLGMSRGLQVCVDSPDSSRGPCILSLTSASGLVATLATTVACLLIPRTSRMALRVSNAAVAVAWWCILGFLLGGYWALWTSMGPTSPDGTPALQHLRMLPGKPSRHIERAFAMALAQSLVAIGSDLHYVAGQPGQGSRALYAGLVVVVVALYALLAPFLTIIVRPRWLNGSGVEPSCAVLVARVFSATARFVLRTPQVSAVAVSKWLANSILAASVLALVAASLAGFPVPPGAALAALLAWVLMVRVTGRLQVGMAATALDEALTRDVANTVMGRALRPDAANPRSVASPLGNSLPQQPEGASPLHSAHPAVHPAPASTVGSAALGSWHAAVGETWQQAVASYVPPLPYLRECKAVTVVFTDIVGYTHLSSTLRPSVVLQMLHQYFSKLDALMDITGTYKYQTVGDAYVVIAGFPDEDKGHAMRALRTAFAMIKVAESVTVPAEEMPVQALRVMGRTMKRRALDINEKGAAAHIRGALEATETEACLQIRVGIHTGPLAASTLGFKRSCLTLVGDTLNTASRMESSSRPGHVRMSAATYSHLPADVQRVFAAETLDVKGKGPMQTYIASHADLQATT